MKNITNTLLILLMVANSLLSANISYEICATSVTHGDNHHMAESSCSCGHEHISDEAEACDLSDCYHVKIKNGVINLESSSTHIPVIVFDLSPYFFNIDEVTELITTLPDYRLARHYTPPLTEHLSSVVIIC